MTIADSGREYLNRLRSGDMGSLPAILGLVFLFVVFSSLNDRFLTTYNMANLVIQSASIIVLAMGIVFVLLLGEIDLSAGFAGGVCAAVMVRLMVGYDLPWPVTIGAALITGIAIGLLANMVLFFMFFKLLADPPLPARSMWSGALLGAVLFEVLKQASRYLLQATSNSPAFQAFGIALILVVRPASA